MRPARGQQTAAAAVVGASVAAARGAWVGEMLGSGDDPRRGTSTSKAMSSTRYVVVVSTKLRNSVLGSLLVVSKNQPANSRITRKMANATRMRRRIDS